MIDSKCKKCRRIGQKLFLKGERCFTPKCPMVKKPYPPGIHGKRRGKRRTALSEYGKQLKEKQRIRTTYGILERQFKRYVKEIMAKKGDKRQLLLRKLEKRLDNLVFRLGLAKSRSSARQLVSHGHILVNQKKVNIPSYQVKVGDLISLKKKSQKLPLFENLKTSLKKQEIPSWLSLDKNKLEARVISEVPTDQSRDLQALGIIIEYYSR